MPLGMLQQGDIKGFHAFFFLRICFYFLGVNHRLLANFFSIFKIPNYLSHALNNMPGSRVIHLKKAGPDMLAIHRNAGKEAHCRLLEFCFPGGVPVAADWFDHAIYAGVGERQNGLAGHMFGSDLLMAARREVLPAIFAIHAPMLGRRSCWSY